MISYDVAVIGSGPISLFEAIYQSKKGKSVVVIEEKDQLGGAWTSIEYEPGHCYEIGCHIWDVNKDAYRFVENYLGEKLLPLNPPPVAVWRDMKIPYDWKNNILALRILLKNPKRFFSSKRKVRMQLIPRDYHYPKGGSEALLDSLKADLARLNIKVLTGFGANSVEVESDVVKLRSQHGSVSAKQLICTSFSFFPEVKVEGRILGTESPEEDFWHFQFVVRGNQAKSMSYARILGHPFIHRVSDISSMSPGDHQVFSIGVFTQATKDMTKEEVVDMIDSALRNWRFLSGEATVFKTFDNRYVMKKPDLIQRQALIDSGKATFIQSTNLSFGIAENAERWSR